jgi:hypothetical protein
MEGDDGDSSSMENIDGGVVLVVREATRVMCHLL